MDMFLLRLAEAENTYAMLETMNILEDFAKRLSEREKLLKKSCIQR